MKKTMIILMLFVCTLAFFGCDKNVTKTKTISGPGLTITDEDECSEQVIHVSPRYGQNCETGKLFPLAKPKLDSVSEIITHRAESIHISDSQLRGAGYEYQIFAPINYVIDSSDSEIPKLEFAKSNNGYHRWSWLGYLFQIIFGTILIALALWFLWWLFNQRPNRNAVGGNGNRVDGSGGNGGAVIHIKTVNVYEGDQTSRSITERAPEEASAGELMLQIINTLQESGADGVEIHIGSTNFKATKLNKKINLDKNSESASGH